VTACLVCHQWSDHEDWYHNDDDPTVEEYLAQFVPDVVVQGA
jgi:hypothetical protein